MLLPNGDCLTMTPAILRRSISVVYGVHDAEFGDDAAVGDGDFRSVADGEGPDKQTYAHDVTYGSRHFRDVGCEFGDELPGVVVHPGGPVVFLRKGGKQFDAGYG